MSTDGDHYHLCQSAHNLILSPSKLNYSHGHRRCTFPVTQETFGHACSCAHVFFQDAHKSEQAMGALTYDCWCSSPVCSWSCGLAAYWAATVVKYRSGPHWWWARWPRTRSRWSGGTGAEISAPARGPCFCKSCITWHIRSHLSLDHHAGTLIRPRVKHVTPMSSFNLFY